MSQTLQKALIAILFYRGEAVSFKDLGKLAGATSEDVQSSLKELSAAIDALGLVIVMTEEAAELRTGSESSELIESIRKEELTRELGKAGLETLSIILYKGPATRAEIEYVRGVNSTAILRNLLIRGLVEKVPNPQDQRSFLYKPSIDLLSHLGVPTVETLPEFAVIKKELELFEAGVEEQLQ